MFNSCVCGETAKVAIRSVLVHIPNEEVHTIINSHQTEDLVLPWNILEKSRTSEELCNWIFETKRSDIDRVVRVLTDTSDAAKAEGFEFVEPRRCILDLSVDQVKAAVKRGKRIVIDIAGT